MVHAAAAALICLALAGSLAACAAAPGEGQSDSPRPSPAGGPMTGSPSASPSSPAATPSSARSSTEPQPVVDGLVVFDGDSLTEGFMLASSQSYPAQALRQLPAGVRSRNVAVSGQTWPQLLADVSAEVDPLYSPENGFNILIVWAGANDLAAGYSAQQIYDNARTYCLARKQRGFTVVICTMYPLQPQDYDGEYESLRLEYNELLRDAWQQFADALVDLAGDTRIGDDSPESRAGYFEDVVHLNEAGYGVIADAVVAVVRPLVLAGG